MSEDEGHFKEKALNSTENSWEKPSKIKPQKTKNEKIEEKIAFNFIKYTNKNTLTLKDLKNGRRVFNNKTELRKYDNNDQEFNTKFIEFRQLFFEDLLLTEDFRDNSENNPSKQPRASSGLFSTFVYESEFLEPLISVFKMKSIIVKHDGLHDYNTLKESGNPYINFIYPKISRSLSWGKFHSKLIILKFDSFLRVIVPTANLTNGDWYYWGQLIWFQDFPLKSKSRTKEFEICLNGKNKSEVKEELKLSSNSEENLNDSQSSINDFSSENSMESDDFLNYLKVFLSSFMINTYEEKRIWKDLGINLDDYDFSDAAVDLVASANGRYTGENMKDFGVGRIRSLMEEKYCLDSNENLIVQCSSFSTSTNNNFFDNLYSGFNLKKSCEVDIYYPTVDYINSFPLGKELTGCLFLSEKFYSRNKEKFHDIQLKEEYKNYKSVFHSKIFITGKKKNGHFSLNKNSLVYIGSHNLSAAAWGNYEKNGTQIAVGNYECGILFNNRKIDLMEKLNIYNIIMFNFNNKKYGVKDKPFIQEI